MNGIKTYCSREKRKTDCVPGSEELVTTSSGRDGIKCICASCGARKFSFVPKIQVGTVTRLRKRKPKVPEPKFDYKKTWERILDDDRTMRKFPEKVFEDDIIMQKIPIDNTKFRELMRKPKTSQWQKILADDIQMRKKVDSADDRFKQFMKDDYNIRAMKRSIGPGMTKKQMEAIGRQNLADLVKAKEAEIYSRRSHNARIRNEVRALTKMLKKAAAMNASPKQLNMIATEIVRLENNLM